MAWEFYGDEMLTADATGKSLFQAWTPNRNLVLRAARCWVVLFGDPTFTNLSLKLYANREGEPGVLLETSSTTWDPDDIYTDRVTNPNAVKEVYFEFANPALHNGATYHFVLNADGYTYSEASCIAWKKAWPDPVYRPGVDRTTNGIATAPKELVIVGDDL
jgi:hypothetical protein